MHLLAVGYTHTHTNILLHQLPQHPPTPPMIQQQITEYICARQDTPFPWDGP